MATGHRVIERGLRPDGTPRKPIRVREGYHPPDEAVAYVPPQKKEQTHAETKASAPLSLESKLMEEEVPLVADRPKTKSQLKNEKKNKNKREKKLELKKKLVESEHCRSDALLDGATTLVKDLEISEVEINSKLLGKVKSKVTKSTLESNALPNVNGFDGEVKLKMDDLEKNGTTREAMLENSDLVENTATIKMTSMDEIQDKVGGDDFEKQQKKLRKKLDQITKLLERGDALNDEEKVKVGKKGEWEDEMRMIEKRLNVS